MAVYDFGKGLSSAGAGALAGSAAGGIGAIPGGLLGLLGGLVGKDKSQHGKWSQQPNISPEQQQLLSQLLQMLGGEGELGQASGDALAQLKELMDPSSEAQQRFADPHMQQFQQQTLPGIAERFAGAGAQGGALSSSGFGQALGGAAAGLQTQLAGMKSELQKGSIQDILGQFKSLLGQGLGTQSFSNVYQHPTGSYATGQF